MITDELKALVRDEADKLRTFAPPKAKARLDFTCLNANQPRLCIYGQMTGNCFSGYATRLLNQCAHPFSRDLEEYQNGSISSTRFSSKCRRDSFRKGADVYFSAIEFYIYQKSAKNDELIAYIKGETDILKI